jgi:hypothetical protein
MPCERLCWELDARFGGGPASATPNAPAETDLAALGEPFIRCAQDEARRCREGLSMADASQPDVSWTGLFLECAGLPPDLEL